MFVRVACVAVFAVVVAGCKKKEVETPVPAPAPAAAPAPAPAAVLEFGPVVDPVNFESGVVTVAPGEMAAVDKAAEVLKGGDWKVVVVGLADSSGDAETNKVVSQQRADAVAAELRKKAEVSDDRIAVRGIGERLATGATQSERKVEFVFYKNAGDMNDRQIVIKSGVLEQDFREKQAQ